MPSKKKLKKTVKRPKFHKLSKKFAAAPAKKKPAHAEAEKAHDMKKAAAPEKMDDGKALEMIKSYGIPVAQHFFAKSEKDVLSGLKKTGYPAVMKVSGRRIIHKTELGGIIIASSEEDAKQALKKLLSIKGAEKVLVQKKLEGIEVIVGAKRDPQFGAVVVFGFGGIYTEIIKDVVFRICPVTPDDAEQMIKSIKGYEILTGARGKTVNIEALKDVLVKICKLASREGIREMDINPLFINEEGCWAADVRIVGK